MSDERTCEDCANCLLQDYGWSNYTWEGTTVHCMVGQHPEGEFDRFYGKDERLNYAQNCPQFVSGGADHIDVDGENFDRLSPIAQRFLRPDRDPQGDDCG